MDRLNRITAHVVNSQVFTPCPVASASSNTAAGGTTTSTEETIKEFFNAFSSKEHTELERRIEAILAEDFSYVGGDGTKKDKKGFVGTLPRGLDIHIRDNKVYVNSDGSVGCVISVIPSMKLDLCEVFTCRGGKINTLRVHR